MISATERLLVESAGLWRNSAMKLNISGRIVEVEDSFKDLAPEDQDAAVDEIATSIGISAKPTPKEPEVIQRSAGDYVKDLAVPLFGGLARGGQTIAGLADIVNTPIRAGVEAITGRPAGTVTGALKEMGVDFNAANQAAEDLQSDASKEEAAKVDAAFNEGLLEGGRELFRNPMQIAEGVAGTIPDLASMGMAVKGIAMKIYKEAAEAAIKNGASREVAEQIAKEALKKKAPELAAKSQIIEGAYTAGSDAGAKAADGLTAEETGFSLAKGAATTLGGKLANKIGGKIGLEDIEAAAATDSIAGSMKNRVNLFLQRGASEALEEAPQGVMERMVDNLENGRPIMEGTGRNAVEGAITGAFAGGGMSLAERRGSAAPGREYSDAEMGRKPEPERPASLEQLRDPEAWAQKQAEMAGQPKQITDEKIIYADSPGKVERESARVERRNRQQQEGPVIAQGSDQKRLGHEGMIYAQPPEYYDAIKTKLDAGEELTTAENRAIAENPEAVANARVLPSPEEKAEIDQRIAVSEQKAAQAKIKQVEKLVSSAEKGLDKAVEHFGRDSKEASIAAENLLLTKRELKKYTQKPVEESKKEVPAEEKQTEEAAPEDIEISVQERQDIEEIEKKARADSAKEGLSSARKNVAKAEKDFRGVADLYATDPKRIAAENNLVLARREFFKAKEKVTAAEKDSKAVARVAAEVTKTEKPGYNHPTVDRFMQGLIDNWGYDSEGGRIITRENVDYQGQGPQVVGKTKWIPKSEHMISGYSKEYLRQAWEKAKSGQKLGHAQKALVDGLVDSIIEENPSAFADDDPNADLPWAYRRRGLTKNSRRAQN
ncbi:MAG TPA: hypothetical protein VEC93_08915 [Anaerolineae bacterium]|nr:hypothetical protein [Anaerolineae bacterium]